MAVTIDLSPIITKVSNLTGSAKKLGAALFAMAGLYQVEPVRDAVMPFLIKHPHISSIAGSVFGLWMLLHNPVVQKAGSQFMQLIHPEKVTLPAGTPVELSDVTPKQ